MKKKTYSTLFLLFTFCFFIGVSCVDDDDNNTIQVDEEWKALNDKRFSDSIKVAGWESLTSQSGEGQLHWKKSTVITESDITAKMSVLGKPEFTDTVVVRFEAWYYDKDNKKIVAASTENPSYYSLMANPNKIPYKVCVNRRVTSSSSSTEYYRFASSTSYSSIDLRTDAWATLIQDMNQGEEREAIVPYYLGYNGSVQTYIPAYTMLRYRIKLLTIIPMAGRS